MAYSTINPYDQSAIKLYQHHSLEDSQKVISKMVDAQKKWRNKPVEERAKVLKALAANIRNKKDTMAKQASLEMGKPISQGKVEVEKCAATLELVADMAIEQLKKKNLNAHYGETTLVPEPYGVVFSVQPWNFPYWQLFRMASCAWMAGNLVILKHAEAVSGCAELIEDVCSSSGECILANLRLSHETAAEVIRSRQIAMVTLTGSTRAGKEIGKVAGESLKKQVLELGGADAYIVMPDCDLEFSVATCVKARIINSGQSCVAAKRFFVHESIYEKFKNLFLNHLQNVKVGSPFDEGTQIGPMASKKFADQLKQQIGLAQDTGAEFTLAQAPFEDRPGFSPIGILDFGTRLTAFESEEIFGPIASLYKFKEVDDVITVINEGPYGLGGGVFSTNIPESLRIAEKIDVGTFTVNSWVQSDARVPFGGRRESGLSYELGSVGLNEFVQWKVIGIK